MNDDNLSQENSSKEQRILRVLRKVLANIVKDTTPTQGMLHPLSEGTREDIRDLFGLIAEREKELADLNNPDRSEKPYFAGDKKPSNVINLPIGKKPPASNE